MSSPAWNVGPDLDDGPALERPSPVLVSLHFIRTALRRRIGVCVLAAVLGLLGAGAFMLALPPAHAAEASLVLPFDSQVEPTRAMATNVSLLQTRTLAIRTLARLSLTMEPEAFLNTVTIEPSGSELLLLTMTAPTDAEAVRRLDALTATYLEFRAEQLSLQSNVLADGLRGRIQKLQADVRDLTTQIEELNAAGASSASKLNDTVAQRGSTQGQVETLQQSLEDVTLRNSAVVESSRLLDPPAPEPGRAKRTVAIGLASGLIGGIALGCGSVLFFAITSDRLRRRSDVAIVIGAAVSISVGRIAPVLNAVRWLPPLRALDRRRTGERQRLAYAIEAELFGPQRPSRLAVAGIDNAGEVGFAVAAVARELSARGSSVTVVDLTQNGGPGLKAVASMSDNAPTVLRPRGLPELAHRPADLHTFGRWDDSESAPPPELSDITLVLTSLDPAVGADHLTAWTDRVVVVVTAGRSNVERIRTVGDQIRAAGLDLRFAALLRTERKDDSLGILGAGRPIHQERPVADEPVETAHMLEAR